jgi:hypothetical protein
MVDVHGRAGFVAIGLAMKVAYIWWRSAASRMSALEQEHLVGELDRDRRGAD